MKSRPSSAYPALTYYYCACGMIGTNPEYHRCSRTGEELTGAILENFKKGSIVRVKK